MEKKEKTTPESGFRILNLLLLESSFKREPNLTLQMDKITSKLDVNVGVQINENIVYVTETVNFTNKVEDVTEVSIEVVMVGVFEKYGQSNLDLDTFGKINGAAIIYPYVREHVTNLSAKAGMGLIFLPPFNFTVKPEIKETDH